MHIFSLNAISIDSDQSLEISCLNADLQMVVSISIYNFRNISIGFVLQGLMHSHIFFCYSWDADSGQCSFTAFLLFYINGRPSATLHIHNIFARFLLSPRLPFRPSSRSHAIAADRIANWPVLIQFQLHRGDVRRWCEFNHCIDLAKIRSIEYHDRTFDLPWFVCERACQCTILLRSLE